MIYTGPQHPQRPALASNPSNPLDNRQAAANNDLSNQLLTQQNLQRISQQISERIKQRLMNTTAVLGIGD